MAEPELRSAVRSMLYKAAGNETELPIQKNTQFSTDEGTKFVEIDLFKVTENDYPDDLMYLVFKELHEKESAVGEDEDQYEVIAEEDRERVEELEEELKNTKEQLQVTIEDYETSNEELRSSNEELQSMNEELQTTTEELETSQEELQSVNEELQTVNAELEDKIEELNHANNDLRNMTKADPTGLLILDRDFKVQRFTEAVTNIFNLIDSDIDRPLEHLNHNLAYGGLMEDVKEVLNTLQKKEKIVTATNDEYYMMEISPYLTSDDKVKGVVLSFVDITKLKTREQRLQAEAQQVETLAHLGQYVLEADSASHAVHRGLQLMCETLSVDYCVLLELDRENNELQLQEVAGQENCTPDDVEIQAGSEEDPAGLMDRMEPSVTIDFEDEDDFTPVPVFFDQKIKSGIHTIVEGNEVPYGILGIYAEEKRSFTEHDRAFVTVVANILAEMIDRKNNEDRLKTMHNELQEEYDRSRELQQEVLDNSMNERWELGSYLHDTLAQKLVATKMVADSLKQKLPESEDGYASKVDKLRNFLDNSITEVRNLSHDIVPVAIESDGVEHAIGELLKQSEEMHDIECEVDYDKDFTEVEDRKLVTNLYLVAQEAVKNAVAHGSANRIKISIETDDKLNVEVKDDGSGLPENSKEASSGGLRIMQHRINLLDGSLQIENDGEDEFGGAVVKFSMPLNHND